MFKTHITTSLAEDDVELRVRKHSFYELIKMFINTKIMELNNAV